ncbi:MAG: hypothetical protein LKJ47_05600 [Bifidobacteriaceae bacterium]|nr:hypothetical protein [Bifidobacteriaceae bacterium]
MRLPSHIPSGARIVVRIATGVDPTDGRMKYSDYLGHVESWDGTTLILLRDPSRDGSRPVQRVSLAATDIVALKPIPERREFPTHREPRA